MLRIYGASDDLIEFEGDIEDEVPYYPEEEDGVVSIVLSDGTTLGIQYKGTWTFSVVEAVSDVRIKPAVAHGDPQYSDILTIETPITWAVVGGKVVRKKD